MEPDTAQGDPSWNAVEIHMSCMCTHAWPNPAHGPGFLQAAWEMICKVSPSFLTVCNCLKVEWSGAQVCICPGMILAALESSLALVMGFIDGKYFSVEALGCSHVNCFLVLILVNAALIWTYLLLSLPMSATAYFKWRMKLLPVREYISDNIVGRLSLEDIELGILERKILLMCSPASAFGGLVKQGAHIKDGIFPCDANVCTPVKPTHAGAGATFLGSLARCYVSKQAAKAPALLAVGNEDVIFSTLRKAVWFGSARRRRSERLRRCRCQAAARHCLAPWPWRTTQRGWRALVASHPPRVVPFTGAFEHSWVF